MKTHIGVVIPCYRAARSVLQVLRRIGPEVSSIYIVDDQCPENTGKIVQQQCRDSRVQVLFHEQNKGVGGATITGYRAALKDGCEIVVKLDGDGQMDPALIARFIRPIENGQADYTKGNRFFTIESLALMPKIRVYGNAMVSFLNKIASGYWDLMDPANGFTAIHSDVLRILPLEKLDERFFFESDMLFRLGTVRAVVRQIPMEAVYGDEESNLDVGMVALEFPRKYLTRFLKRIFYSYFLRDFNVCSIELLCGTFLTLFGTAIGLSKWYWGIMHNIPATTGTVMLAALPVILGFQLLLAALTYDVMNVPRIVLHPLLKSTDRILPNSIRALCRSNEFLINA